MLNYLIGQFAHEIYVNISILRLEKAGSIVTSRLHCSYKATGKSVKH